MDVVTITLEVASELPPNQTARIILDAAKEALGEQTRIHIVRVH